MAAIWVFAEYSNGAMDKVTYEVVSEARRLPMLRVRPLQQWCSGAALTRRRLLRWDSMALTRCS